MTDRHRTPTEDASRAPSTTRRTFVKAAGAAGIGGALATSVPGSASAQESNAPPRLERESRNSNLIVDPQGNRVTVRGVNIVDPLRAARDAPYYKVRAEHATNMATDHQDGWHSQCIRIPLQPNDIAREGAGSVEPGAYTEEQLISYLEDYVEPAIEECAANGVYCILDYHRHWPDGPRWDDPDLSDEIHTFWEIVAPRYDDEDHVIYELFNEPTEPYAGHDIYDGGPDVTDPEGEETWLNWREHAQPWVDTVRDHSDNLLLIGNPRWSQWTYWAPEHEFEGENLAYVGHFYTQDGLRPLSTYFGEPSEQVPVFITEFGWGGSEPQLVGDAEEYAPEFTEFFSEYDACHWTAWCFDFDWEPSMLNRDYEVADEWGQWVKDHLAEWQDLYQPADPNADVEPPTRPESVDTASIGATSVTLDWSPVEDADRYTLYVDGGRSHTTDAPPATITGLEAANQYFLGVNAVNAGGSSGIVEIEVNTGDDDGGSSVDPPRSPDDQWTNEVTSTTIELEWEPVENADSYNVYVDGSLRRNTEDTVTTIGSLSPDTAYELGLESVNAGGTSDRIETTVATEPDGTTDRCADAAGGAETIEGRTVCDVTDDGYYRDVTGDGELAQDDVVAFFENQHREGWKQPDMFDFSGNGEVNQFDVVELFDYVLTN